MDVERLMKDLTVEQLHHIQGNLQNEMEGKKEELREMVGRRYRDVLEASSEVRNIRKLAETLAEAVSNARATQSVVEPRPLTREQQASVQRFIALHKLVAVIGDSDGDALSDAFALTLAELLHKELATEPLPPSMHSVVTGLTGRLIRTRRQLLADLEEEIGELSDTDWVANQLTALALLQGIDYEKLLDIYFKGRKNFIQNLTSESSSLLTVVNELKKSLVVIEQLFSQGELFRIIQAAASPTYRPALIDSLIGDEAFSFGRMLTAEAEKVTRQLRESKTSPLLPQKISSKCAEWISRVCDFAREPVTSICEFYEKAGDIIEFLQALSGVLRADWPRISSYSNVYQNLFGDILFKKFTSIIARDLRDLEEKLTSQLKTINLAPPPLFEKTSNKFDNLIGVGISPALEKCISSFYVGVQNARDCCAKYEQVEMDSQPERIREALATELFDVVERLSNLRPRDDDGSSTGELSRARLCLALLHCDSTSFCQAMNRDGERISKASRLLKTAAEDSLSKFVCDEAKQCLSKENLRHYVEAFAEPAQGMQLALEWERLELKEIGVVEVPIVFSPPLQTALFTLSCRLGEVCIAHLLSRPVRKRLASEIADLLSQTLNDAISSGKSVQRTWIQLLFDCRVLISMYPDEKLKKLIPTIESHIDPFDLSVLAPHLATNVRLAVSRSQLLYSCLLLETVPAKEGQGSPHYSQVVDVLPKVDYPPRIPLIPRLERTTGETVAKRVEAAKAPRNKLLASTNPSGMKSTPSLSSFVDKISSSWFGGN
ncbi:unnamed protein product [Cylicocyclus nassatus]|uniref:Conserved oligomeric Golgi complex subunit 1 n=1 Tax=Cylicocyclus nassatus TaxID=53992 RepID=A0AA36DVX4_CYLNA|nr:unnamed protein product [Cylicocyclus nassatus]